MRQFSSVLLSCLALVACGGGGTASRPAPASQPPPTSGCNEAIEYCGSIPGNADPCTDTQYWPLSSSSGLRPLTVHYSRVDNEAKALEMIALLEESWNVQVDTLGFTAPLDDQGDCGLDGNFDVFIWPGTGGAFVSSVGDNPATPHEDFSTYMAIDIGGSVGGELLDTYMAHEFNHAVQASDDWTEDFQHYEAGATFAEALVYPDEDDWFFEMEDFQGNPQWSLFFDDNGATWYTYAAAMYLHYLYERLYPDDPAFYARIWRSTRSAVGDDHPDYFDALRSVLMNERGVTIDETVLEFSQWRWFVDQNDDGNHYSRGAQWPHTVVEIELDATSLSNQSLRAMVYGANYFRLTNNGSNPVTVTASLQQNNPDADWRLLEVQTGEVTAPLEIAAGESVVVVAVVLPVTEIWSGNLVFDYYVADLLLN